MVARQFRVFAPLLFNGCATVALFCRSAASAAVAGRLRRQFRNRKVFMNFGDRNRALISACKFANILSVGSANIIGAKQDPRRRRCDFARSARADI